MEKAETPVTNLSDFLGWTEENPAPKSGARMLYRGQSSRKWEVSPSLCRRLRAENNNEKIGAFELWQRTSVIIRKVRELGHHHKKGESNKSALMLLAELQHFGAATCLIDFTRSPLVALWFACQRCETDPQDPGKVIAIDSSECENVMTDKHHDVMKTWKQRALASQNSENQDDSRLWTWPPEQLNDRIIAQQSEFVFGKPVIDEADTAKACIIPANKKDGILSQLKKAGISEESLFPDFDGFVRTNRHGAVFPNIGGEQHYQEGVECLDNKEYEYALEFFRMAREAYEAEGAFPPQKLLDQIKKTKDAQNKKQTTRTPESPPDSP